MLSVTFRLILKHLHNPSTDQSLDAWKYSPDAERRITATPYITWQVVGYRRITFLEPLRMCARRNFTHETDQAKAVLSSTLSDVETSRSSPGCCCGPALEGPPEPGPGPQCWALRLCCAGRDLALDQSFLGSSGQSTWVKELSGTTCMELILGHCAGWSASCNS